MIMSGNIRPIETEYAGYRFRSRLEARWALWMDTLHIPYVYEPEGYEADGVRYLPDFWLPKQGIWAEVKPEKPNEKEIKKACMLADGTDKSLFFLIETPTPHRCEPDGLPGSHGGMIKQGMHLLVKPGTGVSVYCGWGECACCSSVNLGLWGEAFELEPNHWGIQPNTPRLLRAYRTARSARFERYPKNMRTKLEDAGYLGGGL
jgi:hypothetical protein